MKIQKRKKKHDQWMRRLLSKLYIVTLERWNDIEYIRAYGKDF